MKTGTGIILRLVIVLVIAAVFVGVVVVVVKGLNPNEFKLTATGVTFLDNAEKEFKNGDDSKAWEDLNKAKEYFKKAVKANAKYYRAHYELGRAYLLEAEKSTGQPDKAHDALSEADKSYRTVVFDLGARWHTDSVLDLCKIYDQYRRSPESVRVVAEIGLKGLEDRPLKESDPDYLKLLGMRLQLHHYLGKSTRQVAQGRLFSLMYEVGETMADQDKKLAYAETALDFKKAEDEYLELKKAAEEKMKLPEDVTPAQVYSNLGEIELHLLDCYWRIYEGKGVEFTGDPDIVAKRKDVYTSLGILIDPENKTFRDKAEIRKEIGEKTTSTSIQNVVDDKTINYFDLARKAAEDDVKNAASDSDAEKAKTDLENTLLNIGRAICLYGIVPPDLPPSVPRPGENFLDEILKNQSVNKTDGFYIQYADILANIGKRQKAQDILQKGITALNSPGLRLALGRLFASQNRFLDAKTQFEAALAADNESQDARYYMADLLITMAERGNKNYLKDATAHVDWLTAKYPDNVEYMVLKGRLHMQTPAEYGEAQKVFQQIYDMSGPTHFEGAYMLGIFYNLQGDKKRAEDYLMEAKTAMGPNASWGVYLNLAIVFLDRDNQKALDLCNEYIKYAANQHRLVETPMLAMKARCEAALGLKDEARKTYDELIGRGEITAALDKGYMLLAGFTTPYDINMAEYEFNRVIEAEKDRPFLQKTPGAYYGLVQCKLRGNGDGIQGALNVLERDMAPMVAALKSSMASGTPDEQLDAKNKYIRYLTEKFNVYKRVTPPDTQTLVSIANEMQAVAPNDPATINAQLGAITVDLDPDKVKAAGEEVKKKIAGAATDEEKQSIRREYAQMLFAADLYDEAQDWFRQVLEKDPNDFVANHNLALICISKREFDEAKKCVQTLEQASPGNQQVLVLRLQLDSSSAPDIAGKIAVLKSAVEQHSDMAQLHFMLAQAYEEASKTAGRQGDPAGNLQRAIDEYLAAFKMSGSNAVTLGANLALARLNLARMKLSMNDLNAAKANYEECRKIVELLNQTFPANSDYMRWLAECKSALAKNVEEMDKAIQLYEDAKDAKLKELAEAESKKDTERVKRLKTDVYYIFNDLVGLLSRTGNTTLARAYNDKMKEYASETREKLAALVASARILEDEKKYDEAVKVYQDALDNPDITQDKDAHIELFRQLAQYYSRRRDAAESNDEKNALADRQMKALGEGLALYPDSPVLTMSKVELLWRKGEQTAAENLLEQALKDDEKKEEKDRNPNLYIAVALFREAQAQTPEDLYGAEEYMRKALELAVGQEQMNANLLNLYLRHLDIFKDKANAFVAGLLEKAPDNALYITFKAQLLAATGDPDGAIEQYKQAIEKEPTAENAYIGWRDAILQKSPAATQDAIEILQKGLASNPMSSNIKTALGLLYMNTDPSSAKKLFQAVLDVNNRDRLAVQGMAYVAAMNLASPEGVISYTAALDEAKKAISEDLYKFYPDSFVAQRLMGILSLHEGDASRAVDYFKEAISLGQDTLSLAALSHLALERQTVKVDYAGLKAWAMSLGGWRDNADLEVFIGRCSMKAHEDGADANFKAAAALADKWANPHVFMDIYYLDRARVASADEAFEGCVKRLTKDAGEAKSYALAYVEAGYPDRAVQLLERAAGTAADDTTRWQLDALRAYIYLFEMNDPEKAKGIAQQAASAAGDASPAEALCVIGKTLCDAGDLDNGIAKIKDAIKADPADPRCRAVLAEVYYNRYQATKDSVRRDEARGAIQDAVRMDPYGFMMVRLYLWLGDAYFDQGKKEEAAGAYKKFFELGGKAPEGREKELADRSK